VENEKIKNGNGLYRRRKEKEIIVMQSTENALHEHKRTV
jgi:hypothetical protein